MYMCPNRKKSTGITLHYIFCDSNPLSLPPKKKSGQLVLIGLAVSLESFDVGSFDLGMF